MLSKEDAIQRFNRQMKVIDELRNKPKFCTDYQKWYRDTEVLIEKFFGKDDRHIKDFKSISYSLMVASTNTPDYAWQNAYLGGLSSAKVVLESFIDEINDYWEDEQIIDGRDCISIIEKICGRFPKVARQLGSRQRSKKPFDIMDEYDVQDLLHALLLLEFDDIRPEEWTPSYAGSSSRVDFLLKNEKIIIEVKKTRTNLKDKEVGEQLIIDIERYQTHQDCKKLVCFVYDPDHLIENSFSLENDLKKDKDDFMVKVIIAPKL